MRDRQPSSRKGGTSADSTILGVTIRDLTTRQILNRVQDTVRADQKLLIFPVNVNVIMKGRRDEELRRLLGDGAVTKSDGAFVVWAARILGKKPGEVTTGWVLFEEICKQSADTGEAVFFLGGEPGIAEKAASNLRSQYPGLRVVGVYSPTFGLENEPEEREKIIRIINEKRPAIVFVGMGVPKQEKWIATNKDRISANVFMAIGGSFDFYAHRFRRPPLFVVRLGLGWLWRLAQEPRRLSKRYLIEDSPFFLHVFLQKIRGMKHRR